MKPNEKEERCFKNACRGGLRPRAHTMRPYKLIYRSLPHMREVFLLFYEQMQENAHCYFFRELL